MNKLTLRTVVSPYDDTTKGAVLTQAELDNNFISLKGEVITSASTSDGIVSLVKYNGEVISFSGGGGGGGGTGIIEKTRSEMFDLISTSSLTVDATYKITDTHINLYNDGTYAGTAVYIKALSEIKLASDGYGEFYNPKYDKNVDGYGIWMDDMLTFTPGGTVPQGSASLTYLSQNNTEGTGTGGALVVDSLGNKYIGNFGTNRIYKVDSSNIVTDFSAGGGREMVITSTDEIIAIATGTSLYRISSAGSVSIFANIGTGATHICIDDEDTVYVYCDDLGDVYKITSAGTVTNLGVVGPSANGICVENEFKNVYVSLPTNIYRINTAGQIIQHGDFQNVSAIAAGPTGSRYIYISKSDGIDIIQLYGTGATATVVGTVDNTSGRLYTDSQYNIYVATTRVYKVTPYETILVSFSANTRDIYVDNFDNAFLNTDSSVYRIDSSSTPYPSEFYDNEEVTSNNGDTGTLIGPFSASTFFATNGSWKTASIIIGQSSGSRLFISNVTNYNYPIGSKVIWGGYSWTNLNGNTGDYYSVLELDPSEWSKDVYDETNYNKVIDEIEYDFNNDLIIKRREVSSSNEVICNNYAYQDFVNRFGTNTSPINVFQFGNENDVEGTGKGLVDIKVNNSYFENINFIGGYQKNILISNGSYQSDVVYARDCSQEMLVLTNESYQRYLNFSYRSSQFDVNLNDSYQLYITLGRSAYQELISLKSNSNQDTITLGLNAYQQNIDFLGNSNQQNTTLGENIRQTNIVFEKNCYVSGYNFDSSTLIGDSSHKTIYNRPDGTPKLRYYNNADTLVIADVNF